jgi:hypothetical protein
VYVVPCLAGNALNIVTSKYIIRYETSEENKNSTEFKRL